MEALFVSIIEQLVKVTRENAQQELMLVTGVEKEVKKLERNLKAIQCVLKDAEQKQIAQEGVKLWIESLKEVAYDMDDVLDEWNTAILESKTLMLRRLKYIGRLTSLRELKEVKARVDGNDAKEFSVGDLENLDLLRFLRIRVVGNKVDEEDAKRAKLHKKMHLKSIRILKRDEAVKVGHFRKVLNPPYWLSIRR